MVLLVVVVVVVVVLHSNWAEGSPPTLVGERVEGLGGAHSTV